MCVYMNETLVRLYYLIPNSSFLINKIPGAFP